MSKVSIEQLREVLEQVCDGRITAEALQELIEKGQRLGWPRLLKAIFDQARKTAEAITDAYWQAEALASIAGALAQAICCSIPRK